MSNLKKVIVMIRNGFSPLKFFEDDTLSIKLVEATDSKFTIRLSRKHDAKFTQQIDIEFGKSIKISSIMIDNNHIYIVDSFSSNIETPTHIIDYMNSLSKSEFFDAVVKQYEYTKYQKVIEDELLDVMLPGCKNDISESIYGFTSISDLIMLTINNSKTTDWKEAQKRKQNVK